MLHGNEVEITENSVRINGTEVDVLEDGIEFSELSHDDLFTITLTIPVARLSLHQ
ncbi:hypothetical protein IGNATIUSPATJAC_27 [Mycobacterium phage IgnatiusPatJac]|nr:hypothetical protein IGNATIUSPATJAC_27 [Mycobacterium phage IgnatiusPatJac]